MIPSQKRSNNYEWVGRPTSKRKISANIDLMCSKIMYKSYKKK